MTSMVSSVAAALEASAHAVGMALTKEQTRFLARAAIEAMREPSEWMLDKGSCYEDPDSLYEKHPIWEDGDIARNVWKAMIDTALPEDKPASSEE